MKSIFKFFAVFVLVSGISFQLASCSDDRFTATIFDTKEYPLDKTSYTFPLDTFCKANFLEPYNVQFIYKMEDIGSDMSKNLVPASYEKSVELAVLTKYLWLDIYTELAGEKEVFLKKYSPRIIHVIGSKNYNPTQGTETLGVAEGGIKISLFNVNNLNVADIDNMNEYFFKTMHHEFGHILDQTFLRPTEFNVISNSLYNSAGWTDTPDSVAAGSGFVSPYASSAAVEDWVEVMANYITRDSISWSQLLNTATYDWEIIDVESEEEYRKKITPGCDMDTIGYFKRTENGDSKVYRRLCARNADGTVALDANGKVTWLNTSGIDGKAVILRKLELVRKYLKTNFELDIDELRYEVQRRQYVMNPDGTFLKDARGRLVNNLTSPSKEDTLKTVIEWLVDKVTRYSKH